MPTIKECPQGLPTSTQRLTGGKLRRLVRAVNQHKIRAWIDFSLVAAALRLAMPTKPKPHLLVRSNEHLKYRKDVRSDRRAQAERLRMLTEALQHFKEGRAIQLNSF